MYINIFLFTYNSTNIRALYLKYILFFASYLYILSELSHLILLISIT